MRPFRLLAIALTATAVSCWAAGCLSQESQKVLRYDAKTDRFHLLAVYQHFRSNPDSGSGPAADAKSLATDTAKLRHLYDTRDRLIPGYLDLSGPALAELNADRSG